MSEFKDAVPPSGEPSDNSSHKNESIHKIRVKLPDFGSHWSDLTDKILEASAMRNSFRELEESVESSLSRLEECFASFVSPDSLKRSFRQR